MIVTGTQAATAVKLQAIRRVGRDLSMGKRNGSGFASAAGLLEGISKNGALPCQSPSLQTALAEFNGAKERLLSSEKTLVAFEGMLGRIETKVRKEAGAMPHGAVNGQSTLCRPESVQTISILVSSSENGLMAKFAAELNLELERAHVPKSDALAKLAMRLADPGVANTSNIFQQLVLEMEGRQLQLSSQLDSAVLAVGDRMVEAADLALSLSGNGHFPTYRFNTEFLGNMALIVGGTGANGGQKSFLGM